MKTLLDLLPLLPWTALWASGGWMLVGALFRLRRGENPIVGFAAGLILQVWLANLLARILPLVAASWTAAAMVGICGIGCVAFFHLRIQIRSSWAPWLVLAVLFSLFTLIGRGLGIFDDYQNLPTISVMATGDVPPHFALNPSLNFGYHYLLLLFAAQLMRLGHMFPWTALDTARGLIMALPLVLAGFWAYRLVRSRLAAFLAGAVVLFSGGSRWVLLMLPTSWLAAVSDNIKLIGSASTSAANYAQALLGPWKIDGAGPIPFPFAFYTGMNQPFVMAYTGISGTGILILLILLLIAPRSRHWLAAPILAALLAALAMANEIAFLLLALGFLLIVVTWIIRNRSWRLSADLRSWVGVLLGAVILAGLQGGLLTELVRSRFLDRAGTATYFDTSLAFVWPPAMVSAHLGPLSVFNLWQLLAGLMEIGPIIIITPLLFAWGWKAFRLQRWYEAALISAAWGSLIALFVSFKGPLYSAAPRLMSGWFFACALYAVPLTWAWARNKTDRIQVGAALGLLAACLSGMVLLGVQLLAIQRPVLSTFLAPLDARMSDRYWDRLDTGELIFDPLVYRAPTVFGRYTDSSPSWYSRNANWQALVDSPDPRAIRSAGFTYVYFDSNYWDDMTPAQQSLWSSACVKQIAEVQGIHSEQDYTRDFRRLLDIRACE